MKDTRIVVSVSGGKDSTATAILALDTGHPVELVCADTGHEHEETYRYLTETMPAALGLPVTILRADFTDRIAMKRRFIETKWAEKGVPQESIDRALRILQPTGNPFLDLCMWKGRFPSRMAQFCTQELKRRLLDNLLADRVLAGYAVESWRGVRRDESQNRRNTPLREPQPEGWTNVHPIAEWTGQQTVDFVVARGVPLNPLYSQGCQRVGCMPCINVSKDELAEIARRFPEHIDRVREWEVLVSEASKRGATTFFTDSALEDEAIEDTVARLNIDSRVQWAMTSRGGKQLNMLRMVEEPMACSSVYGLCE